MADAATIFTKRLALEPIRAGTFEALVDRDIERARLVQGCDPPSEYLDPPLDEHFLHIQLEAAHTDPKAPLWGPRTVVLRDKRTVIRHCGFHGVPEIVGRAEIGYTIFVPYRRCGYATEAVRVLIELARDQGERSLFASVRPDNFASPEVVAS
jgi:RimJ/RimL family protein N-acetyltransferase